MSRYTTVYLVLLAQIAFADVEQPVEGFSRIVAASHQAPYGSNRGIEVLSSYEYARDGTEAVAWESAPVPEGYIVGHVTFVWSCGMASGEDAHELYLNDEKIVVFRSGLYYKDASWQQGDVTLRFEPITHDINGEAHGLMYLRVPTGKVQSGRPAQLEVRGTKGGGAWFMLHHFDDSYAKSPLLTLPSGRRVVIAPPKSVFRALGPIRWSCVLAVLEEEGIPAETFHLWALLKKEDVELTVEREIRIEPDQQQVELALWPKALVPLGEWEINLAFSQEGVELLRWRGMISVQDLHMLDFVADWPSGSLEGSLRPALKAAGMDWSRDYIKGFLGSAFAFSMNEDGGPLWQGSNYERLLSPQVTSHLAFSSIDAAMFAANPADPSKAKAKAWDHIRGAIDEGYPVVVRMRDTGNHTLPGPWSLIVGYDEEMETYALHNAGYGPFTSRRNGFADEEPVNWTRLMVFRPQAALDVVGAGRDVIEHAIESSAGTHPGTDAPAHGLAAWEMWLNAFQQGTVNLRAARWHATFLLRARRGATTFLRGIEDEFPTYARPPLLAAADRYDQVIADMTVLRELVSGEDPDLRQGAEILSAALEAERAALASLQQVLARL